MFETIPQSRLLTYILIGGACLPLFMLLYCQMSLSSVDQLALQLEQTQTSVLAKQRRQAVNFSVMEHFKDADRFYIDKHLETLSFLENEVESIQKVVNDQNLPVEASLKKRLEFLTSPANHLVFSEGVYQNYPQYQEVTETLVHPVEVNAYDLKKILSKIEGVPIGEFAPGPNRPQLIVLDFKLDKKKHSDKTEDYVLNLKLLKREYQTQLP